MGGPRLVYLPSKGEGKRKIARIENPILQNLIVAPILLKKSDLCFFLIGVPRLVGLAPKGEGIEKIDRIKNLNYQKLIGAPILLNRSDLRF